ncbi:MAG: transcription-repair coupling factor, partial [Brevundimonas sp.]
RALPPAELYLDEGDWNSALAGRAVRRLSPFHGGADDAGGRLGRAFGAERAQDSVNLFEAVADHAKAMQAEGRKVLFASWSEGSSERLAAMLGDHGLPTVVPVRDWADVEAARPDLILRGVLPVEHGFATDSIAVISETDILGDRLARPRRKRRASNFLAEASALTTGDLVVHLDHGIGRYEGLRTLDIQSAPHDCLEIFYAGDSKLFLPVENIDLLTRYGSETDGVQLDRLGGAAWQTRKARAKARLREMAEGLIALAAKRALRETDAINPPQGLFDEFCARFPYEETDDQLNAIGDVLEDLGKGTPMDRLICGDVGFGKTEVALRAAFVVAMAGQQVAIVCPTKAARRATSVLPKPTSPQIRRSIGVPLP